MIWSMGDVVVSVVGTVALVVVADVAAVVVAVCWIGGSGA